ncbi:MAG TPA: glycoside hydrolase domain-containing protein [Myxococcaceae bacterium]|nr:glycoside hydrolase domain-containing protein [Myxococcaceae bacterium]
MSLLPVLLAASLSAAPPPPSWAFALPAQTKVRPERPPTSGEASVVLGAARGECEGFQVLAPAGLSVKLDVPALRGPGVAIKPRAFREAFIRIETPSNGKGDRGLWPDPLIPLDDPAFIGADDPFRATPDAPYVAYLELCVPEGQAPGTYRGQVRLTAPGKSEAVVQVTLEVWTFQLPATSSLPNSFGLSLYSVAKGHKLDPASPESKALLRRYAESLLRHRISAQGLSMEPLAVRTERGELTVDFTAFDAEVGDFLSGRVLPNGARFTSIEIKENPKTVTPRERGQYWQKVLEHFREKGWKAQPFFYAKDEPKPQDYPTVLAQAARLHEARGVPVLVTSPFEPSMAKAADILCPNLNCFFTRSGAQTCKNVQPMAQLRQKVGPEKNIWWYQSCNSHGCTGGPTSDVGVEQAYQDWASYMVDHPALSNRAMGSLAFLVGVGGELYFDTVAAYQGKNPWESLFEFGGNGDGTFFYPGAPALTGQKRHAPVESLRLKHIRDGLEDFEYLTLLASGGESGLARELARSWTPSGYELTLDPAAWAKIRERAASRLKTLAVKADGTAASRKP